ncbi:MAG: hypothetical protein GH147_09455 [Clostridia bacterium]|nr:hypothetical protein [Clostridia bacterium]
MCPQNCVPRIDYSPTPMHDKQRVAPLCCVSGTFPIFLP